MAIKIYLLNPTDEIFTDGTFTPDSLEIVLKEAAIVKRGLALAEKEKRS